MTKTGIVSVLAFVLAVIVLAPEASAQSFCVDVEWRDPVRFEDFRFS